MAVISKINRRDMVFTNQKLSLQQLEYGFALTTCFYTVDTGRKLNVHNTFRRRPAVTAVIFPENSHSLDTLNRVTEHYERYRKLILKWFLDTMNAINLVIFFLFKKL